MSTPRSKRIKIFLAFFAIYFVWGTTYLAALLGLESIPPFLLSALRFCTAGVLLLGLSRAQGLKFPTGKPLMLTALSGIVMLVGGSGLVTWSEQYILSGHAAVVVASEPFFFVLLDRQRWKIYFNNRNIIAGLLIGFSGIVLFVAFSTTVYKEASREFLVLGYTVLLISCLLWVAGSIFSSRRNNTGTSTIVISVIQLLSAGIFSLLLALITNEFEGFSFSDVTARSWVGWAFLTIGGSLIAYLSFVWLLTVRTPAQVSTHTYINPVVALFMGWWIVDDPVNYQQMFAVAIILAGVVLSNRTNHAEPSEL